jgi:tetratricopeptide (TPR) repeat protein
MNKTLYTAALGIFTMLGTAQTLQEAITKTENERFDLAAGELRALIAKEPNKGENYFYLGENYFNSGKLDGFQNGELDSANIMYSKGVELNPTSPLNYVGLGKVLLAKGNVNDAKAQFFKAASVAQNKNPEVMRQTAEAWLVTDNKNPDEAITQINNAIKIDPKNAENYILLGDAQLEKNPTDGSTPIKSYQQATTLNPKSAKGILREGKLYQRGRNYPLALEKYRAALAQDPTFAPAYREIAELYFLAQQNAKSIENWKKYLELNNSDYARYRFMSALYKNKQYSDAIAEYENLKKANFNNPYLERLAAYSYYEMGDKTDKDAYTKGMAAMNNFFNKAGANFKYIGSDYKYKGMLMMKTGQDSLGILEMEKGIAIDPKVAGDVYSEIANTSYKNKRYDRAIIYYEKKVANDPKSLNNNDWFNLGRSYYFSGGAKVTEINGMKEALIKKKKDPESAEVKQKEAEANQLYVKADSAFAQLARLNPSWPVAYLWRGRANASMDPKITTDNAKVQYEKVLSTIKPEEVATTYKKEATEAHEYLGYYFFVKNNNKKNADSDTHFNAVKELDPANEKAHNYFNPPKPAAPKPAGGK